MRVLVLQACGSSHFNLSKNIAIFNGSVPDVTPFPTGHVTSVALFLGCKAKILVVTEKIAWYQRMVPWWFDPRNLVLRMGNFVSLVQSGVPQAVRRQPGQYGLADSIPCDRTEYSRALPLYSDRVVARIQTAFPVYCI